MFWLLVKYNFYIIVRYIKGIYNDRVDIIFRLYECLLFIRFLSKYFCFMLFFEFLLYMLLVLLLFFLFRYFIGILNLFFGF